MKFLFDIGRVLLDFDFERSLSTLLPHGVEDPAGRLRRLLERKDEFESGQVAVDEYVAWALEILQSEATADEFCEAWRNIFTPNEPMWRCVRQLKADGHKLVLFSNINAIHVPWIYEAYPQFELFDGAVMSFQVGCIKPRPEIYRHAIEQHGMEPGETLYIDDLADNVEGGRRAGFHTWQYRLDDHAAFEAWLDTTLQVHATPSS